MIDEHDVAEMLRRRAAAISAVPADPPAAIRRARRRLTVTVAITAVVSVCVIFGAAVGATSLLRASRTTPADVPPVETPEVVDPAPSPSEGKSLTLDKAGVYFLDVRTGEATRLPESLADLGRPTFDETGYQPSPDGSRLLFVGAPDGLRSSQIFVANIDGTDLRQLTDDPDGASWASWSPDGTTIVYVEAGADDTNDSTYGSELILLDVETGEATMVARGVERSFQYPRFSPDGTTILFTRPSTDTSHYPALSLWTIPIGGGEPSQLVENGYDAVYSPDGTTIAFHRGVDVCLARCHGGTTESQIWFADADGTNVRAFGGVATWAPRWSPDGSLIAFGRAIRDNETVAGVPVGSTGPGSGSGIWGVVVFDPETGAFTTIVKAFVPYAWLDDHTLLVG